MVTQNSSVNPMDTRELLERLAGGHFLDDVDDALVRVSAGVLATGRPGVVMIKLKIERPTGEQGFLTVNEEIGVSLPKTPAKGAFVFAHQGRFYTQDPRQANMDLRVLRGGQGETRRVGGADEVREASEG